MQKRISVRNLVEFILRSGSIDSGITGRNRLEEGARVHRKLQKAEGYQAEVFLSITETHSGVEFTVEGRADGIIITESGVTVDEIKSTLTPLELINEDHSVMHWAQVMCYGYIYSVKNGMDQIDIRLTYYEMETGGIKRFTRSAPLSELQAFFARLLEKYAIWVQFEGEWKETAIASMKALGFPFESYRGGQRKLAAAVYRTILAEGRLFAMAPTGIGKTISTVFPTIKAMGEGTCEKIFYLTARTVTRQAAQAALDKMRDNGLRVKTVAITAKDKICFLDERKCSPAYCEYADGHYDRINDAIMDVLRSCENVTHEIAANYAKRHMVCPYELTLDLTLWSDVIICDYNYAFDPQVYLKRFFTDGGDYVLLIDEAHNLADRAREMYSALISKRDILAARGTQQNRPPVFRKHLNKINKHLIEKRRECDEAGFLIEKDPPRQLISLLEMFAIEFSGWLGENPDPEPELLEVYFDVLSFLKISEFYNEAYATLYETGTSGELTVKLYCSDPSCFLDERFSCVTAATLFSATLTPARYFIDVLGGGEGCKYIALPSPFPQENLLMLIAGDISIKYKDRDSSTGRIADMIKTTAEGKSGNYIVYFPSYKYLTDVHNRFCEKYPHVRTVRQETGMTEDERDRFLSLFDGGGEAIMAFCVLGGIFSEGIDLIGERLIGTVIVGVGLPQINRELDIVRDHFDETGRGFDFAYRLPGMNKVLQAAGRVIRSEEDKGVVLLIDDRFTTRRYTELFPEHWQHWRTIRGTSELSKELEKFWGLTSSLPQHQTDAKTL